MDIESNATIQRIRSLRTQLKSSHDVFIKIKEDLLALTFENKPIETNLSMIVNKNDFKSYNEALELLTNGSSILECLKQFEDINKTVATSPPQMKKFLHAFSNMIKEIESIDVHKVSIQKLCQDVSLKIKDLDNQINVKKRELNEIETSFTE